MKAIRLKGGYADLASSAHSIGSYHTDFNYILTPHGIPFFRVLLHSSKCESHGSEQGRSLNLDLQSKKIVQQIEIEPTAVMIVAQAFCKKFAIGSIEKGGHPVKNRRRQPFSIDPSSAAFLHHL